MTISLLSGLLQAGFSNVGLLFQRSPRTHQIRVGSLVTNVNLRDPSLLAKMTSTVDNISDGRLIVGLGTGDKLSRKELTSYGYRFASLGERIERLKESIQILKAMWIEEETTFHGKYYRIARAVNFPKPKQRPRPPIWVGGKHPRVLDIVAEEADGWNYWGLTKDVLERRTRYFSDKCTQCGRDPGTVVRSWSGTYQQLSRGATSHSELVDSVAANLRDQTEPGTRYFIASFSSRSTGKLSSLRRSRGELGLGCRPLGGQKVTSQEPVRSRWLRPLLQCTSYSGVFLPFKWSGFRADSRAGTSC